MLPQVVRTRLQVQRIQLQRAPPTAPPQLELSPSATRPPPLEPPIAPAAPSPAYRGLAKTIKEILREAGWRGFYRGLGVNLVRTVPNSAVTMLTCVSSSPCRQIAGVTADDRVSPPCCARYELIMRYLTQDRNQDD